MLLVKSNSKLFRTYFAIENKNAKFYNLKECLKLKKLPTIIYPVSLSFTNSTRFFFLYGGIIVNGFMTGVILHRFMVLLRTVFGAGEGLLLEKLMLGMFFR